MTPWSSKDGSSSSPFSLGSPLFIQPIQAGTARARPRLRRPIPWSRQAQKASGYRPYPIAKDPVGPRVPVIISGSSCLIVAFGLGHGPVSDPTIRCHHAIARSPLSARLGPCRSMLALGATWAPVHGARKGHGHRNLFHQGLRVKIPENSIWPVSVMTRREAGTALAPVWAGR